jgi:predicted nucleotidyltransferase
MVRGGLKPLPHRNPKFYKNREGKQYMDRISLLRRQLAPLKGDKRIVAVMLFGSWARNEQKALSDIDVCVIPARGIALDTLVGLTPPLDTDVSYFYNLPLHVREKVLSEGKPLLMNDREAFLETKVRAVVEYLEFKPLRERLISAMLSKGVF